MCCDQGTAGVKRGLNLNLNLIMKHRHFSATGRLAFARVFTLGMINVAVSLSKEEAFLFQLNGPNTSLSWPSGGKY